MAANEITVLPALTANETAEFTQLRAQLNATNRVGFTEYYNKRPDWRTLKLKNFAQGMLLAFRLYFAGAEQGPIDAGGDGDGDGNGDVDTLSVNVGSEHEIQGAAPAAAVAAAEGSAAAKGAKSAKGAKRDKAAVAAQEEAHLVAATRESAKVSRAQRLAGRQAAKGEEPQDITGIKRSHPA